MPPTPSAPARRSLPALVLALVLALVAAFLGGGVALPNVTDQPTANTTQPGLFDNNAYGDTGDTGR